jgi:hypothetical protein
MGMQVGFAPITIRGARGLLLVGCSVTRYLKHVRVYTQVIV